MNIFKQTLLGFLVFIIAITSNAADISKYEATCKDIGFKKKTDAYAECVMELIGRDRQHDKEQLLVRQKAYQQEQQAKRESEARAIEIRNRELEQLRVAELQRRQELAQEQARQAENSGNGADALLSILGVAAQAYNAGSRQNFTHPQSTQYIQPLRTIQPLQPTYAPRQQIDCSSQVIGRIVNTQCR